MSMLVCLSRWQCAKQRHVRLAIQLACVNGRFRSISIIGFVIFGSWLQSWGNALSNNAIPELTCRCLVFLATFDASDMACPSHLSSQAPPMVDPIMDIEGNYLLNSLLALRVGCSKKSIVYMVLWDLWPVCIHLGSPANLGTCIMFRCFVIIINIYTILVQIHHMHSMVLASYLQQSQWCTWCCKTHFLCVLIWDCMPTSVHTTCSNVVWYPYTSTQYLCSLIKCIQLI
jgi:hypothetical protein